MSKKSSKKATPKVAAQKKQGYGLLENAFRVLSKAQASVQKYEEFSDVLNKTEEVINEIDETLSTVES